MWRQKETFLKKRPTKTSGHFKGLSYRQDWEFKKRPTKEMLKGDLQKYYRPQKEPDKRTLDDTTRASLLPTRLGLQKETYTRNVKKRPTKVLQTSKRAQQKNSGHFKGLSRTD